MLSVDNAYQYALELIMRFNPPAHVSLPALLVSINKQSQRNVYQTVQQIQPWLSLVLEPVFKPVLQELSQMQQL